jgi:hypothetical protein
MLHLLPYDLTNKTLISVTVEGQTQTELDLEAWLSKLIKGKTKETKEGIRSLDKAARDGELFSIFFQAVRFGAPPKIIRFLQLEMEEAEVYATPRWGEYQYTPLHYAAAYRNHAMVTTLIDLGADPNWSLDYEGWTPIL